MVSFFLQTAELEEAMIVMVAQQVKEGAAGEFDSIESGFATKLEGSVILVVSGFGYP
jgi:hypothetical protein